MVLCTVNNVHIQGRRREMCMFLYGMFRDRQNTKAFALPWVHQSN